MSSWCPYNVTDLTIPNRWILKTGNKADCTWTSVFRKLDFGRLYPNNVQSSEITGMRYELWDIGKAVVPYTTTHFLFLHIVAYCRSPSWKEVQHH